MKLTVHVVDGRSFVMSVGTGENTVKWLSLAAGQRASRILNGGKQRARDTGRMGGSYVVHHMSSSALERQVPEAVAASVAAGKIAAAAAADEDEGFMQWLSKADASEDDDAAIAPSMYILQPDAKIRDVLRDGDEIFLQLQRVGELDVTGAAAATPWRDAAYGASKSVSLWRQALRERIIAEAEAETKAQLFPPQPTAGRAPSAVESTTSSRSGGAEVAEVGVSRPSSAASDVSSGADAASYAGSRADSAFSSPSLGGPGGQGHSIVSSLRRSARDKHDVLAFHVRAAGLPPAMPRASNTLLSVLSPPAMQGEAHGASVVGGLAGVSGALPLSHGTATGDVLRQGVRHTHSITADLVEHLAFHGRPGETQRESILITARPLAPAHLRNVFDGDLARLRASRLMSSRVEGGQLRQALWEAFPALRELFVFYSISYAEGLAGGVAGAMGDGGRGGGPSGMKHLPRTTIRPMHDLGQFVPDELSTDIALSADGILMPASSRSDPMFTQSRLGHACSQSVRGQGPPLTQLGRLGLHTLTSTQPRIPHSPASEAGPLSARGMLGTGSSYSADGVAMAQSARMSNKRDTFTVREFTTAGLGGHRLSSSTFAPSDAARRQSSSQVDVLPGGSHRSTNWGGGEAGDGSFWDPEEDIRMPYEAFLMWVHDTRLVNAAVAPHMDIPSVYCSVVRSASAGSALMAASEAQHSHLYLTARDAAVELSSMLAEDASTFTASRAKAASNGTSAGQLASARRGGVQTTAQLLPPADRPLQEYLQHSNGGRATLSGAKMSPAEMAAWLSVPLTRAMFVEAVCELTVALGLAQARYRMAMALHQRQTKVGRLQTVMRALQVTSMLQRAVVRRREAEGASGVVAGVDMDNVLDMLSPVGLSAAAEEEAVPPGHDDGEEVINPFSAADGSSPPVSPNAAASSSKARSSRLAAHAKRLKRVASRARVKGTRESLVQKAKERAKRPGPDAHRTGGKAAPVEVELDVAKQKVTSAASAAAAPLPTVDTLVKGHATDQRIDAREVQLLGGLGNAAEGAEDDEGPDMAAVFGMASTPRATRAAAKPARGKPTLLSTVVAALNSVGGAVAPTSRSKVRDTSNMWAEEEAVAAKAALLSPTRSGGRAWTALRSVSQAVEFATGLISARDVLGGHVGSGAGGKAKAPAPELPAALFEASGMAQRLFVPEKLDHLLSSFVLPRAQHIAPTAGVRREMSRRRVAGVLAHERQLLTGIFSEYCALSTHLLAECAVSRCVRSVQLPLLARGALPPEPVAGVLASSSVPSWAAASDMHKKRLKAPLHQRRNLDGVVVTEVEGGCVVVDTSPPPWRLEHRMGYLAFRQLLVDCGLYHLGDQAQEAKDMPLPPPSSGGANLCEGDVALAFLLATEGREQRLGVDATIANAAVVGAQVTRRAESLLAGEAASLLSEGHQLAPTLAGVPTWRSQRGEEEGDTSANPASPRHGSDGVAGQFTLQAHRWLRQFRERVIRSGATLTYGEFLEALCRVGMVRGQHREEPPHEKVAAVVDTLAAHKSWLVSRAHRLIEQYADVMLHGRRRGRARAARQRSM